MVVADDVAVGKTQGAIVGRRGLAGTVLVYKIASSLARQGGSLDQVEALAKCIADRVGTVGVGLGHCHVRDIHRFPKVDLVVIRFRGPKMRVPSEKMNTRLEWV